MQGGVVLIEDVNEDIDTSIENILQKAIFENDGLRTIRYADKDVAYDDDFRLFMTSKLPNPKYGPEVCIKVTLINFTVTFDGLEEQLLADVVLQEEPLVEKQREELVINLANFKNQI